MMRWLVLFLVIIVMLFAGYEYGRRSAKKEAQTQLIENYSFVREIAELASLEAVGMTTFKSTNLTNDGSWSDAFRRTFLENTVRISVPYTAKYGVNLKDAGMRIERKDSVVAIYLPQPRLLSYELHLDRVEVNNKKGLFISPNDELYTELQRKLYAQSRSQLAQNALMLNQSRDKVCTLLKQYFAGLGLQSVCIFNEPAGVISLPQN